ncbi:enoyl-CoA hydratase/isomerase family protein [Pseudooceanicola sediminis]|uniref:3-hydroxyisobutyryl-CoA hydrolase n=1 Tax=Pseudooceanicola sediminis TaxID=2211117 RepID=A0A399J376_9RHOB|nr:enoyl-CoA hydratase/isomerase family protein [Pseudooceanicola sediminis]KAA2317367.1 enoyl-CoA hydratase/isomerase family protein [Puniceibacterium sp. HSS470]RII39720.1 enoyl-CoA hydratase/isomerase family protein [Pseudooceanicola sediminis]|tara:strand:+ start:10263 stop:11306 length:1044 start_codon:yes stop_codon:yes gene_type:complete
MSDINICKTGRAGHITLTREGALNALTYDMGLAIEAALLDWAHDDEVALVIIDAAGDKAFCAGGDIRQMYDTGIAGDFSYGRTFWRDEYRMNARLAEYPKPVVTFLHGFVMGGGVGVGCHASHRITCESTQIAMPEVGIGLVPDVGGSLLLANAPGRLGDYLALTAARMGPADAIHAGFADHFVPADAWDALKSTLISTGRTDAIRAASRKPEPGRISAEAALIDALFGSRDLPAIIAALEEEIYDEFAAAALKAIQRNAPLSMACALEMLTRLHGSDNIRDALSLEYRFTYRAMQHGDFLEGIRAQIIDRDRKPKWRHALTQVPEQSVNDMLAPLGAQELTFDSAP